ncbi:MAG: LemA family protein [Thermodesulfovibrionales bacterium]
MAGWILLGVLALCAGWAVFVYNSLVSLRNEVQSAWRQIDVQLKRRHDLIPNLVSAVKGVMEFEQDTLEKVISARTRAVSASGKREKASAEQFLTEALGKLFAVMERYPVLRSNDNVKMLQEELTSTENRISFSRQFYNDLVANYRSKQEIFPNSFIALLSGRFEKEHYFEADDAAKVTPLVDLSIGTRYS